MIAKALPLALLAGAASAACPLSVEIASSDNHVVNVAVTNTGEKTLSIFKGNTVFSDHATKDLLVTDAGVQSNSLDTGRATYSEHWLTRQQRATHFRSKASMSTTSEPAWLLLRSSRSRLAKLSPSQSTQPRATSSAASRRPRSQPFRVSASQMEPTRLLHLESYLLVKM